MKYYAVRKGRTPGIYTSWSDCQQQVNGYKGAEFKSFKSKTEAENFLTSNVTNGEQIKSKLKVAEQMQVYVDGSFDKLSKRYGYGGVVLYQNQTRTFQGSGEIPELATMRNVAGEIIATMRAVEIAKKNNVTYLEIYYDYEGIAKWALGEWQAKKTYTQKYRDFMQANQKDITIQFKKVAAHTGVYYNEQADQLAKEAAQKGL